VLAVLSLGFFMTMLDLTIVNVAIPSMQRGLHASLPQIGWVINAYVIVLAVLMITASRLGDLRGRRNLFVAGVTVFTLASAASGLARSAPELIAARAVQGLGAALLLPQTMAIIIATFPAQRRGAAMGIWGGVAGLATIAGPAIGGMLVTWFGWRWIFFVNLPVGVLTVAGALAILPEVRTRGRRALDLPGVVLASAALVAITYGLIEGQTYHWGPGIAALIGAGVVLLAAFVTVQARRQQRAPLLPFVLFRDRNYALMSAANVIVSIALVGMALPLTLYLQSQLGFSPLAAGLTMAPASLMAGLTAPFAGRLADRGGKYLLMSGLTLYAAGLVLLVTRAGPASRWYDLLPGLVVAGLGVGATMSPMQTIASRNVDPRVAGAAAGVLNTIRQTGSVLGSAVVLAVLQNRLAAHVSYVGAMRAAIAIPVGALLTGAALCVALRPARPPQHAAPVTTDPAARSADAGAVPQREPHVEADSGPT
jgi:EmrB/QacA subfamily drug resistance transporter